MVDRDEVRRAPDELAERDAARHPGDAPATEILGEFLEAADDPTRILEAGCGQ